MKSTRLKNSSRAFLLIRFGDTDSILSCTASLLPTLPLSSPLQARSSSLLQLPLSRALLARWAWPPPFLNVRIQVWQNSSRPRPAFARTCFCSHLLLLPRSRPAVHVSRIAGLRARPAAFGRRALQEPGCPGKPGGAQGRAPRPGPSAVSRERPREEGRPAPGPERGSLSPRPGPGGPGGRQNQCAFN